MNELKTPQVPSALGRNIDLGYRSNLLIMLIWLGGSVIAALIAFFGGDGFGSSAWSGLRFGSTLFIVWAMARELDPDHAWSAFVGVALAVPAYIVFGAGGLLGCGALLVTFRILNRVVGLPVKLVEALLLAAFLLFLAWQGQPLFLAGFALAMVVDSGFDDTLPGSLWLGLLMGAAATGLLLWQYQPAEQLLSVNEWAALGAGAAGWLYTMLTYDSISLDDVYEQPVNNRRVQATQGVALAVVAGGMVLLGWPAFNQLFTLWVPMVGITLYVPLMRALRR